MIVSTGSEYGRSETSTATHLFFRVGWLLSPTPVVFYTRFLMSAPATRSNSRFNSDFPPLSPSSKKADPVDFSGSETEASPPPDNEVQPQEVYSGDDVDKARKICEKDSQRVTSICTKKARKTRKNK